MIIAVRRMKTDNALVNIKGNNGCNINITLGESDELSPLNIYKGESDILTLEEAFSDRIGLSCMVLNNNVLPKQLRDDFEIKLAKEKLNAIGLTNVKIFHNEHDKINRFINEKVDYIIDDDDLTCIKAAENNIVALFFKNNASNKIENNNVININNWGEVYKYLILNNNL